MHRNRVRVLWKDGVKAGEQALKNKEFQRNIKIIIAWEYEVTFGDVSGGEPQVLVVPNEGSDDDHGDDVDY